MPILFTRQRPARLATPSDLDFKGLCLGTDAFIKKAFDTRNFDIQHPAAVRAKQMRVGDKGIIVSVRTVVTADFADYSLLFKRVKIIIHGCS